MKVNMTHNESIKTFADIERHLILEDERREAAKTSEQAYVAESAGVSRSKQKGRGKKPCNKDMQKKGSGKPIGKPSPNFKKRGKRGGRKDMTQVECYNCHKMGHFVRDYPMQNQVSPRAFHPHFTYVSSTALLVDANSMWTVDSGATEHIARDRGAFVEYRRLPSGSRWLYVGNNASIEVKGIGTCKLQLRCGQTLFLYDVLYVPEIRRNLVSVISLLKFGFDVNFHDGSVDFIFQTRLFCSGLLLDGFFVLDTFSNNDYISNN